MDLVRILQILLVGVYIPLWLIYAIAVLKKVSKDDKNDKGK